MFSDELTPGDGLEIHFAPFLRQAGEEGLTRAACEAALALIRAIVPFQLGTLWVRDGTGYRPAAHVGRPLDLLEGIPFSVGDGLRAWIIEEGRPVMIPSSSRGFRHETLQGFLAVPMRPEGEPLGAIALGRTSGVFSPADRDLLCRVASLLAPAIRQGRPAAGGLAQAGSTAGSSPDENQAALSPSR